MNNKAKIVLLGTDGDNTRTLFNLLDKKWGVSAVVLEKPVSKKLLLKRRIQKLGLVKVIGQVLFMIGVQPVLKKTSTSRIEEINKEYKLDRSAIPKDKIRQVESVNSDETILMLSDLDPDVIIINGTRIISKKTLAATDCTWLNIHAGITPKYRGVHGGYWALRNNEPELCGVTLHYVDSGIDTGNVVGQALIRPSDEDNFATYPYLQYAAGLRLLKENLDDVLAGKRPSVSPLTDESRLWHHPTIWSYVSGRTKGVE